MCGISDIKYAYGEASGQYGNLAVDSLFENGFGDPVRLSTNEWNSVRTPTDPHYLKPEKKKGPLVRDAVLIQKVQQMAASPEYSHRDACKELGVSDSTIREICDRYGIEWAPKRNTNVFLTDKQTASVSEIIRGSGCSIADFVRGAVDKAIKEHGREEHE